jgi:hypothetical protein
LAAVSALDASCFPISLDTLSVLVPAWGALPTKPRTLAAKLFAAGDVSETKLSKLLEKLVAKYEQAAAAAGITVVKAPPPTPSAAPRAARSAARPLLPTASMSDVKAQLKRRMAQLKALKAAGKMSSAAKCALIVKKLKRQYVAQRNAAQADGSPPAQSAPRRANRTKRVVVVEGEAATLDVGSAAGGGASAPRVTLSALRGGGFLVEGSMDLATLSERLGAATASHGGDVANVLVASRTVARLSRAAMTSVLRTHREEHAQLEGSLAHAVKSDADKAKLLRALDALANEAQRQLAEAAEVHRAALEEAARRMQQRELNYAADLIHSEVAAVLEVRARATHTDACAVWDLLSHACCLDPLESRLLSHPLALSLRRALAPPPPRTPGERPPGRARRGGGRVAQRGAARAHDAGEARQQTRLGAEAAAARERVDAEGIPRQCDEDGAGAVSAPVFARRRARDEEDARAAAE